MHCLDSGCLLDETGSCIRTIHCEKNIVLWAEKMGVNLLNYPGSTLYLSQYTPCLDCSILLYEKGVRTIIYNSLYHKKEAIDYCNSHFFMRRYSMNDLKVETLLRFG